MLRTLRMSHAAYVAYEPCSLKVLILISSRIVFFGVFPLSMFASAAAALVCEGVCVCVCVCESVCVWKNQ